MKTIHSLVLLAGLTSCASHEFMRGTVVMMSDKKTAHVCLGDNDVKAGDKINFYNSECIDYDNTKAGLDGLCKLILLGTGRINKTLNSHYSEVVTDGSFKFKEGTMVEKNKKVNK